MAAAAEAVMEVTPMTEEAGVFMRSFLRNYLPYIYLFTLLDILTIGYIAQSNFRLAGCVVMFELVLLWWFVMVDGKGHN
jgi:hypothetical protein